MSTTRVPRPLRAILAAHFAGSAALARRQLGTGGRIAHIALAVLLVVVVAVPIVGSLGVLGHVFAIAPPHRAARIPPFTTGLLGGYVAFFGITAGVFGSAKRLPWEALRAFPVSARTLFAAELCASATDVITLPGLLGLFAFSVAAAVGNPAGLAFYALVFASHALTLLALPLLVSSGLRRLSRSLRATLFLLPLIGGAMLSVAPALLLGASRTTRSDLFAHTSSVFSYTPTHALMSAAAAARRGTLTFADSLTAGLSAWAIPLAIVGLTYVFVAREKPLSRKNAGSTRLWTFSSPTWGIARLTLVTLRGSLAGRMALAFPLLSIVFRFPFVSMLGPTWSFTLSCVYTASGLMGLLSNQFGLDRHGIKVLMLLPIDERTLLRGKLMGHAAWAAAQTLMLCALYAVFGLASAHDIAIGVPLQACLFVIFAMVGTSISVRSPSPQSAERLRNDKGAALSIFLTCAIGGGALCGVLLAAQIWLPGQEPLVLTALLAPLLAMQQLAIAWSAHTLRKRRDHVIELLSAAG